MMRIVRASLIALFALACTVGTRPDHFLPALGPNGVTGTLTIWALPPVEIELLEVGDSTLTVMTSTGVAIANYHDVRQLSLRQVGGAGGKPSSWFLARARGVSRFPAGITPEIMAKLLESTKQTEPEILNRGS